MLHEGKIRADGRICVPLHLVGAVSKAVHAYAHPGVNKTKEMVDRKYTTHLKSRDLKAEIAADVKGKELPLHYYTDSEFLVDSEKYIIEDIVGHTKVGRGKNRHIQWDVKYKGFPDT